LILYVLLHYSWSSFNMARPEILTRLPRLNRMPRLNHLLDLNRLNRTTGKYCGVRIVE